MARRLAAIMFTDVVGSTRLAQQDERAALELLKEQEELARPVLTAHHGRLVKSTGDGMLVEFGNALEAVQCAVELQRKVHERGEPAGKPALELRIGIHVGDVEESGTDILGDAVNVTARVEPIAEPGGICVSSIVHEHVRNKTPFTFESVGAHSLKGVLEPVEVYRVALPWSRATAAPKTSGLPRLAVLPLANMSSDPENAYFADGMTEELISTVSKVPRLDVISRTSVMRFKEKTGTSMADIAHQLNVGWILEGSVRRAGNRVRTTVQLIEAAADRHLWSEHYDRGLEDIFEIQSEIAQKVADELRIRLGKTDEERIRQVPTQDTEAHLLYLKGRALAARMSADTLKAAVREYEGAIAKDPNYARAYAALAGAYLQLGFYEVIPSEEAGRKVEAAARKALDLDPNLAQAHLAMATVGVARPGTPIDESHRAIRRAIELDPNLSEAHVALATFLTVTGGDSQEARRALERALELDPLSTLILSAAATTYLYQLRDVERAIPIFERVLRMDPTLTYARNNLGLCHVLHGEVDQGIAEIRESVRRDPGFSATQRADLVFALVRAGRYDEARDVVNELLEHHRTQRTGAAALGLCYARLGDLDRAFEWLETAHQEQAAYLKTLPWELGLERLREDPRYARLLNKLRVSWGVAPPGA